MRPVIRAAVTGLFAAWLAPLPALAGSQSSNSSSNCSNGQCSHVESHVEDDRHGRHGWVRVERWHEGAPRGPRHDHPRVLWHGGPILPWDHLAPRPRGRDDDDD